MTSAATSTFSAGKYIIVLSVVWVRDRAEWTRQLDARWPHSGGRVIVMPVLVHIFCVIISLPSAPDSISGWRRRLRRVFVAPDLGRVREHLRAGEVIRLRLADDDVLDGNLEALGDLPFQPQRRFGAHRVAHDDAFRRHVEVRVGAVDLNAVDVATQPGDAAAPDTRRHRRAEVEAHARRVGKRQVDDWLLLLLLRGRLVPAK